MVVRGSHLDRPKGAASSNQMVTIVDRRLPDHRGTETTRGPTTLIRRHPSHGARAATPRGRGGGSSTPRLREFSAKGISGARVDAIAERAGTNKRMIYHYFASKDGLYRAVLHEGLSQQPASGADQEHRLLRLYDRFAHDPDWVRLLMWEALEQWLTASSPMPNSAGRACDGSSRRRGRLRPPGTCPDDIDAVQLALTELAITLFPFAFPQFVELATGGDPTAERSRRPAEPTSPASRHA